LSSELYKVHRPKTLDKIVGNKGTVQALQRMVAKKSVPHTILFSGPSGCGKTTLAKILRRELGCLDSDFAEMNCAQARGVDTIRDIQRLMQFAPVGDSRVWLLDECHQLTGEAQEAALKMLEDTPPHVYFFLATTNPGKLRPTIRTRCTDMPVTLLEDSEVEHLVEKIAKKAEVDLDSGAKSAIVDLAGGSARKALVLLDKVRDLPKDQQEDAVKGSGGEEQSAETIELCRALLKQEHWSKVAKILKDLREDVEKVRWAVLGYMRPALLGGSKQAFFVAKAFEAPFYDSGATGLAAACYEAIHGE
jgi:DNA polymerase-3 subunit gamma/tau